MGMFDYGGFQAAQKSAAPQLAAAEARQAEIENNAQMQANSLRSGNIMGAGSLYNQGMGDNSPIADWLGSKFGGAGVTTPAANTAAPMIMSPQNAAAGQALLGSTPVAAAPTAAVGGGAGAGAGIGASMPYVAAALAGDELLFGGKGRETVMDPSSWGDALLSGLGKGTFWS